MRNNIAVIGFLFTVITVLTIIIPGCSKNTEMTSDSSTSLPVSEISAETSEYPDLPSGNYDGYEFRMLTRPDKFVGEIYVSEETGDVVSDAVFRRNQSIEEKYNIQFVPILSSSTWETDGLNPILAGDDAYDLIFTHARCAFVYA